MDLSINCGPVIASRKAAERLDFLIKDRGLHQSAAFEHFSAIDLLLENASQADEMGPSVVKRQGLMPFGVGTHANGFTERGSDSCRWIRDGPAGD